MLRTPPEFQSVISAFSVVFRSRVWAKGQLLLLGAICCPGSRTICNLLRTVGLADEKRFHKYHRFLSTDRWSCLQLSSILLRLLVDTFVPDDKPLVFGIDEHVERRWGAKIKKRGIYRDAVRSSQSHFVKCSGLRWMCLMLLTELPWLHLTSWALPVLTALCPSELYWKNRPQPRVHKTLMDWASQIVVWLARYAKPLGRPVFLTGDGTYATYELMGLARSHGIGLIARMRLDARLFHFPPLQRQKGKTGPHPKKGKRILGMNKRVRDKRIKWKRVVFDQWYGQTQKTMLLTTGTAIWSRNRHQFVPLRWVLVVDPEGKLDPVLLGCTDLSTSAVDVVRFFVRRWRVEVTFAEARRHLGVETQRQWSDLAIERSTPLLMGLKSVVCLLAVPLFQSEDMSVAAPTWYRKKHFTFSDVLAAVRQQIWVSSNFSTSPPRCKVDYFKAKVRHLQYLLGRAVA